MTTKLSNDFLNTHPGWLAMAIAASLLINVLTLVYFQHKKLEPLEALLSDINTVSWNKSVWGGGFIGRQMRLNYIQLIVLTPSIFYKRGEIPENADKKIPESTRWQLICLFAFQCFNMAALLAFYIYSR